MTEHSLSQVLAMAPNWFLVIAVIVLGYFFLKSFKHNISTLNETIKKLDSLIQKLFDKREIDNERLTRVETSLADCQREYHRRKDDGK